MASIHRPFWGPYTKHGCAKSIYKGEDTCSQQPGTKVEVKGWQGSPLLVDVFGIFDGHGGKEAAVYTSRHLFQEVMACLPEHLPEEVPEPDVPHDLQGCDGIPEEAWREWRKQDCLVSGLAPAVEAAFNRINDNVNKLEKPAGTTATLCVLVGWELLVANVGDSCAYLDTGSEIIQISGNHRLDGNRAEIERCQAAGFKVSPSLLEGKPVGPLRVWPGGLAMSRTLGDADAGPVVLADPEVRQVTIPGQGGRVVIASDGLWDAVHYKTACHHVRSLTASKAAPALVQLALKQRGLRDDVSVVVLDVVPTPEARMPPALEKGSSCGSPHDHVEVRHPLRGTGLAHTWERRREAVRQLAGEPSTEEALPEALSESSSCTHMWPVPDGGGDSSQESNEPLLFGSFSFEGPGMDHFQTPPEDGGDWETVTPKKGKRGTVPASPPKPAPFDPSQEAAGAPEQALGVSVPVGTPKGRRTPNQRNGKRQSRRYEGSLTTDMPPSPALEAKGKKPALPNQAAAPQEMVPLQDMQAPAGVDAAVPAPGVGGPPQVAGGHGYRNRQGREGPGPRGRHQRGREPLGPGGPARDPGHGGHRRPQRRHVGFNPVLPQPLPQDNGPLHDMSQPQNPPHPLLAPHNNSLHPIHHSHGQGSFAPYRSNAPDHHMEGHVDGGARHYHPGKHANHRPRRSGLSGIGRQGPRGQGQENLPAKSNGGGNSEAAAAGP